MGKTTSLPHRFAGGPEAEDLQRWVNQDLTNTQIAEIVGRMYNEDPPPSKQAVAYWLQKHNIKRRRQRAEALDHSDVRPWTVRAEHTGDGIEHRLYDYSNRRYGRPLTPAAERRLDEFLEFLREKNVVVDYDPETADGWLLRPRDPELDDPEDIIRRPR